jgi:hypothetical protein
MSKPSERAKANFIALSTCVTMILLLTCFLGMSCGRINTSQSLLDEGLAI